jgi:protein involved in polysaccharide export with SLBB domain
MGSKDLLCPVLGIANLTSITHTQCVLAIDMFQARVLVAVLRAGGLTLATWTSLFEMAIGAEGRASQTAHLETAFPVTTQVTARVPRKRDAVVDSKTYGPKQELVRGAASRPGRVGWNSVKHPNNPFDATGLIANIVPSQLVGGWCSARIGPDRSSNPHASL